MKYKTGRVSKHIYRDTYGMTNDVLSKELLEKELLRLENLRQTQTVIWKVSVIKKELLNYL